MIHVSCIMAADLKPEIRINIRDLPTLAAAGYKE
jgi:hypothetical protein